MRIDAPCAGKEELRNLTGAYPYYHQETVFYHNRSLCEYQKLLKTTGLYCEISTSSCLYGTGHGLEQWEEIAGL